MPKQETYAKARVRLLAELQLAGYTTSRHDLKVPWVDLGASYNGARIWFKTQAVYLNAHSLFLDVRGMPGEDLLKHADAALHSGAGYNDK